MPCLVLESAVVVALLSANGFCTWKSSELYWYLLVPLLAGVVEIGETGEVARSALVFRGGGGGGGTGRAAPDETDAGDGDGDGAVVVAVGVAEALSPLLAAAAAAAALAP